MITFAPLTESVGATVEGADASLLIDGPEIPGLVLDALERHGVLVFPELHLDDEAQVRFSKRLGAVERLGPPPLPEIFRVTLDPKKNPIAEYLKGTFDWHIDGCTDDIPIMATMLSAHAVAESGGETEFASSYGAYERLSDDDKVRLADRRVVHSIEATQRRLHPDPTPEQLAMWRGRPAKTHPLVWTHRSGRKSLVLGATAHYVEGMDRDESDALLDRLLADSTPPEHVYRHEWSVGDVVLWDNRGLLHRALPYDATSARDMHRTTFTGDERIQ